MLIMIFMLFSLMLFSLMLFSLVLVVMANLRVPLRELVITVFEHEVNRIEPAERGVEGSSEHHRFRFGFSINAFFAMLIVVVFAFMLFFVIFLMSVIVIFVMTAVSTRRFNMKGNAVGRTEISIRDTDITPVACCR